MHSRPLVACNVDPIIWWVKLAWVQSRDSALSGLDSFGLELHYETVISLADKAIIQWVQGVGIQRLASGGAVDL